MVHAARMYQLEQQSIQNRDNVIVDFYKPKLSHNSVKSKVIKYTARDVKSVGLS